MYSSISIKLDPGETHHAIFDPTIVTSRAKEQADKTRTEHFSVGEWVYLKLQPYVQSSLASCSNQKLSYKFFGPFQILSQVGMVAYKLKLPATSLIHPVFHVSQVKKGAQQEAAELPFQLDSWQVRVKILQKRVVTSSGVDIHPLVQVGVTTAMFSSSSCLGTSRFSSQGGGGEMLPTLSCLVMKQTARAQAETTEDGPCRGLHIRKPNVHVNEEWA